MAYLLNIVLMLGLPALVYYLWICATRHDGALFLPTTIAAWQDLVLQIPAPTTTSVLLFAGWLLFQAILQAAAPSKVRQGTPLADATRLNYKMNGWFSFCFTLACLALVVAPGWVPPALLFEHFGPLLTTVNIFAFAFSLLLYACGKMSPRPESGTSNVLSDYFLGTSLNPRVGDFDLKLFFESRPGLIGWLVLDFSLAAKQYEMASRITTPMLLVVAFQFLYVADYFWNEEAILTTWDIKYERFGWMLCWGDLVWVPFTYTLQALYLLNHTHELPGWAVVAIVLLNVLGYVIFRGANIQKHRFRKNPDTLIWGRKPEFITTSSGSLLLTSGWWGIARHANYLGDLLMGLAWCLPCLFQHPLPYFYLVYSAILLIHRERRDHAQCLAKYGADWQKYCSLVRWRIVPGIY
ncbi:MAG TPA: DUF1295 domain-containing protein [Gemmataceae bacterium]|jgi:protein-S-isoprenylcysteine O-methyltransferase Ste14|nr:DUF1295 domain-containing protein [Gemmataceae bacterium]